MISEYLSKGERFSCIKAGALAFAGYMDAKRGLQVKKAEGGGIINTAKVGVDAANSLLVLAALGAGIPIGVFSHVIGRRIAGKRLREEELKEKIKLYRSAADDMAAGLGGAV